MAQQPIFIYGFIHSNRPEDMGPIGIQEHDVRVVPDGEIAAVVSVSPYGDFGSLEKETLLRSLAVYQAAIETVMKRFKIIPMKFGTTLNGEAALRQIMVQNHGRIDQSLSEMEGKIELDVVAFWKDFEAVLKELGQEREVRRIKEAAQTHTGVSLKERQIKVGRMVKESLDRKKEEIGNQMVSSLKIKAGRHFPHSLMDDSMIMNAAFLLDEQNTETFEAEVKKLDAYFEDTINFRIVGPLPPYSFSTLTVKAFDLQEIDAARQMLELGMSATREEIRNAFWKLSKVCHPDKFPGDEAVRNRYEAIAKAYSLLEDYCKGRWCSFEASDIGVRMELVPVGNSGAP